MSDQTFNGPVGQVAGGDINNYRRATWNDQPTDVLLQERRHYKRLLWTSRRRLLFNLPNLVLVVTLFGAAAYALYLFSQMGAGQLGSTGGQVPPWVIFGYAILGIGLPMHFSLRARKREGAIIYDCQAHLLAIEVALNRRR